MKLMKLYKIARFGSEGEFLQNVAQVRGKMKKGGVLDFEGAARSVLQDWNAGKIPYYTEAPKQVESIFEEVGFLALQSGDDLVEGVGAVHALNVLITHSALKGMHEKCFSHGPRQTHPPLHLHTHYRPPFVVVTPANIH